MNEYEKQNGVIEDFEESPEKSPVKAVRSANMRKKSSAKDVTPKKSDAKAVPEKEVASKPESNGQHPGPAQEEVKQVEMVEEVKEEKPKIPVKEESLSKE